MTASTLADRAAYLVKAAPSFAAYHREHADYGGAAREFHARALTHVGYTGPALVADLLAALTASEAECERLRGLVETVRADIEPAVVEHDRRARIARGELGGQHVGCRNPLANVSPSGVELLRRIVRECDAALKEQP